MRRHVRRRCAPSISTVSSSTNAPNPCGQDTGGVECDSRRWPGYRLSPAAKSRTTSASLVGQVREHGAKTYRETYLGGIPFRNIMRERHLCAGLFVNCANGPESAG